MIVVDSNVIAYCWLNSPMTRLAQRVRVKDPDWQVPVLWRSEMRSILAGYLRDGSLSAAQARRVMRQVEEALAGCEHLVSSDAVLEVLEATRLSAYDAEFVALSRSLSVSLVFASSRRGDPQLVEDELGHDDCFDWKGPLAVSGRLWVDAATHAVLRLEQHLAGPTDVRVPPALQRSYGFPLWLTIDRDDLWMSFAEVAFTGPPEVLLLPEAIESRTIVRSGLQSTRRTQVFSDYRRFLTGGKVIRAR